MTPYAIGDPTDYMTMPGSEGTIVYPSTWRQAWGPWEIGGALYMVLETEVYNYTYHAHLYAVGNMLKAYKSTDSGITWSIQDEANSILYDGYARSVVRTGDVVTVVHGWPTYVGDPVGARISLIVFDPATDTWGAVDNSGPLMTNKYTQSFHTVLRSSGDLVCIYSKQVAGVWRLAYSIHSGGIWTVSGTTLDDGAVDHPQVASSVLGTLDSVEIFYCAYDEAFPDTGELYHISLSTGGVVSAKVLVWQNPDYSQWTLIYVGRACLFGGFLYIPVVEKDPSYYITDLYVVDNSTGSWVKTAIPMGGDMPGVGVNYPPLFEIFSCNWACFVKGSDLTVLWMSTRDVQLHNRLYMNIYSGGWDAPQRLQGSEETPNNDVFNQTMAQVEPINLANGMLGIAFMQDYTAP